MLQKSDIREYQLDLIKSIKENKKLLLAVDMGLGKTISCLTAVSEMPNVKKVLIVAPLRVAQSTWPDEFNAWEHLKDLSYTVIKGTEKKRLECLKQDTQFYIINRENMPWLVKNIDCSFFDMIIWDESSSLKNPKLKTPKGELTRFGAFKLLADRTERVILLTGTPTPNGVEDIFGQILILDRGQSLGTSKLKFMQSYFYNISRDPNYAIWRPEPNSYKEIMGKCEHLIIKMKSKDYISLPEFLVVNKEIELDKKEMATYKELKDNLIINAETDDVIVANNPAVLINKLIQFSSGSVYKEDGTYNTFHTKKIDTFLDILEENNSDNILVFYNYKHELEQLNKNIKGLRTLKTPQDLQDWNDGKIKILACHPASAGHGLNLQHGGSLMVWFSLPWSLELYQQANKRLHRSGQKNTVRCVHLLTKNTADNYVLNVLLGKEERQETVFGLMKALS